MKIVAAILQPFKIGEVKQALLNLGL